MELLDLPLEMLHIILVYATLCRGLGRAMRLRLVCKVFAQAVYPAVFETRTMDRLRYPGPGTRRWQLQNQHGAVEVWQRYFVYRCLGERDEAVGRYVEMRGIAEAICRETARDLRDVVEALCGLTLSHGASTVYHAEHFKFSLLAHGDYKPRPDLGLNMLAAAAHFNILPLARRLLAEGHDPTKHNYLFAAPIQVAAQAGNADMLKLFQENLSGPCFDRSSVIGAAMRDDMETLKLALRLSPRSGQDGECGVETIGGEPFGSITRASPAGTGILKARRYTSRPDIHQYLTSALAPWPLAADDAYEDLVRHASAGHIAMVRYLLDTGVPPQGKRNRGQTALSAACGAWHNDVAFLLLERGADPNFSPDDVSPDLPLHLPAMSSNLALARALLDHGARLELPAATQPGRPLLLWAFVREHEAAVRLLLERGASWDGYRNPEVGDHLTRQRKDWVGRILTKLLPRLGCESMARILGESGYSGEYPDPSDPDWEGWYAVEARALADSLKRRGTVRLQDH